MRQNGVQKSRHTLTRKPLSSSVCLLALCSLSIRKALASIVDKLTRPGTILHQRVSISIDRHLKHDSTTKTLCPLREAPLSLKLIDRLTIFQYSRGSCFTYGLTQIAFALILI